jgi:hypothetical protein
MYQLKSRWDLKAKPHRGVLQAWWLKRLPASPCPNRAYIGQVEDGEWRLYIWDDRRGTFDFHAASTDVKALKAIGRIEAGRKVNE